MIESNNEKTFICGSFYTRTHSLTLSLLLRLNLFLDIFYSFYISDKNIYNYVNSEYEI